MSCFCTHARGLTPRFKGCWSVAALHDPLVVPALGRRPMKLPFPTKLSSAFQTKATNHFLRFANHCVPHHRLSPASFPDPISPPGKKRKFFSAPNYSPPLSSCLTRIFEVLRQQHSPPPSPPLQLQLPPLSLSEISLRKNQPHAS